MHRSVAMDRLQPVLRNWGDAPHPSAPAALWHNPACRFQSSPSAASWALHLPVIDATSILSLASKNATTRWMRPVWRNRHAQLRLIKERRGKKNLRIEWHWHAPGGAAWLSRWGPRRFWRWQRRYHQPRSPWRRKWLCHPSSDVIRVCPLAGVCLWSWNGRRRAGGERI